MKSIVFLLLIGQLWTNAVSCSYWMVDSDSELIELYNHGENDTEEEDHKKEKDDKYPIDLYAARFDIPKEIVKSLHSEDFLSLHHPEITTPPPEDFFTLS